MYWAFGVVGLVATLFIAVGMWRKKPLGDVPPKTLRENGLVMLVVTIGFAVVWYIWVWPGL
jgi:hypothetical protein